MGPLIRGSIEANRILNLFNFFKEQILMFPFRYLIRLIKLNYVFISGSNERALWMLAPSQPYFFHIYHAILNKNSFHIIGFRPKLRACHPLFGKSWIRHWLFRVPLY